MCDENLLLTSISMSKSTFLLDLCKEAVLSDKSRMYFLNRNNVVENLFNVTFSVYVSNSNFIKKRHLNIEMQ